MNELMIFKNEEFGQIRTVEIDGIPYLLEKIFRQESIKYQLRMAAIMKLPLTQQEI